MSIVFGWAIVCTENGEPYYDLQGDHIPEDEMLIAAADFMAKSRVLGEHHKGAEGGEVVFAFPMTAEIARAFGIETTKTGLMIGVRPAKSSTVTKFKSGGLVGFSIGFTRLGGEHGTA